MTKCFKILFLYTYFRDYTTSRNTWSRETTMSRARFSILPSRFMLQIAYYLALLSGIVAPSSEKERTVSFRKSVNHVCRPAGVAEKEQDKGGEVKTRRSDKPLRSRGGKTKRIAAEKPHAVRVAFQADSHTDCNREIYMSVYISTRIHSLKRFDCAYRAWLIRIEFLRRGND